MDDIPSGRSIRQSRFACIACKRMKKKCDRREPECSLCLRNGRHCSYGTPDGGSDSGNSYAGPLDIKPEQSGEKFPTVYFTDYSLFARSLAHLPDTNVSMMNDIESLIGGAPVTKECLDDYFHKVHPWIPFISKKMVFERILNPLGRRTENVLLIAAMKLVALAPAELDARSEAYINIKASLLRMELRGILTLRTLQTLLLVAIYELGHAIYPSAYLTLGYCARYGIALGIDKVIQSDYETLLKPLELEEQRRTWWAIILFDRITNLGCPARVPVIEEPPATSILPIDDDAWELGRLETQPLQLSSPLTQAMGRFGLTVQAGVLLGRVFRNIRDTSNDQTFRNDEANVLDRTLAALTRVSSEEGRARGIEVCSPTTICQSARLLLNAKNCSAAMDRPRLLDVTEGSDEIPFDIAVVIEDLLRLARVVKDPAYSGPEISPLCLDAMYRAALVYARISQRTGDRHAWDAHEELKNGLKGCGTRWKAALTYVLLLEARELTGIL